MVFDWRLDLAGLRNEGAKVMTCGLSAGTKEYFNKMGSGYVLVLSPTEAQLIKPPIRPIEGFAFLDCEDVPAAIVQELQASGLISELTEHRNNSRSGWRELGFTDEHKRYFACKQ